MSALSPFDDFVLPTSPARDYLASSPYPDACSSLTGSPFRAQSHARARGLLSVSPQVTPTKRRRSVSSDLFSFQSLPPFSSQFGQGYLQTMNSVESDLFHNESTAPLLMTEDHGNPSDFPTAASIGKENDAPSEDQADKSHPSPYSETHSSPTKTCKRKKRIPLEEAKSKLLCRRSYMQSKDKRRTKTCCVQYKNRPDTLSNVITQVSASVNPRRRETCSSLFLKISHFLDSDETVMWVVFIVKEAIPITNWQRICEMTGGLDVLLNPPIDNTKRLVSSFEGVVQNFPRVTVDLLQTNCVSEEVIAQIAQTPKSSEDNAAAAGPMQALAVVESAFDGDGIREEFKLFLSKGIPITKPGDFARLSSGMTQYLETLPNRQGVFALELLRGDHLEWFAQAMYLQERVVKALVGQHNFPAAMTCLSKKSMPDNWVCEMQSVDFRASLVRLFEMQDTVFDFHIVLLDQTSMAYFLCVQILYHELQGVENQIALETARIVSYNLQALSLFIAELSSFAVNMLHLTDIDPRLLAPPSLSHELHQLTLSNTPPRQACVNSHQMRFKASVRRSFLLLHIHMRIDTYHQVSKVAEATCLDLHPLHNIFLRMQTYSGLLKHLHVDTLAFQMLRATSFAPTPRAHKEIVPAFLVYMDTLKAQQPV